MTAACVFGPQTGTSSFDMAAALQPDLSTFEPGRIVSCLTLFQRSNLRIVYALEGDHRLSDGRHQSKARARHLPTSRQLIHVRTSQSAHAVRNLLPTQRPSTPSLSLRRMLAKQSISASAPRQVH